MALRGLSAGAAPVEPTSYGGVAVCSGSTLIVVHGEGDDRTISVERCDDGFSKAAVALGSLAVAPIPTAFDVIRRRAAEAPSARSLRRRAHRARAPPAI